MMGWGDRLRVSGVIAVLVALIGLPLAATAATPVTIESSLSAQTIRVGDQVSLKVSVSHDPQTRVEFPDLFDKLGSLEVVRRQLVPPTRPAEDTQLSVGDYTITGFIPGRYRLASVLVSYTLPDGSRGTAETGSDLALEVASSVADPEHEPLRDIKPPAALVRPVAAFAQPAAAGALAVAVPALGFIAYRRRARRSLWSVETPLDPAQRVRLELSQAAELPLSTEEEYAEFFSRISAAVRRYLDARLRLDAVASTTREIRRTMERTGTDRWQARIIAGLLEECDSVKWAHYRPDRARAQRSLTVALEIVDLVDPHPDPLPKGEGNMGSPLAGGEGKSS